MKKFYIITLLAIQLSIVTVLVFPRNIYAIQPSTQSELDKAKANLLRIENEMKQAYDYWDICKSKLEQASAIGDVNEIYYANLECERAENLKFWYVREYANAQTYVDNVKRLVVEEEAKEKYTNYIKKRGEVDVAAGNYQQALGLLKTSRDLLTQTKQIISDLQAALPNHPELQETLNIKLSQIPVLQNDIALKETAVISAKAVYDAKSEELLSFADVIWTYGEHKIRRYYSEPFSAIEDDW